jgi:hypothetical protein
VIDFNNSRITRPSQVIDLLRFNVSTQHTELAEALKATMAVLGAHLVRYLHGIDHPPGCEDMISALSPYARQEIALLPPSILRAKLFLRAVSDNDFIPMDTVLDLTVSYAA